MLTQEGGNGRGTVITMVKLGWVESLRSKYLSNNTYQVLARAGLVDRESFVHPTKLGLVGVR